MRVDILTIRDGKDHREGSIVLDGGSLRTDPPDSDFLKSFLDDEVMDLATRKPVTARGDPEAWLENLHFHYRSAYLRATEAK